MKIRIEEGLPFVTISLSHGKNKIELKQVILDTGSAGTIFKYSKVKSIGIQQSTDDEVHRISGVGGKEFVFAKQIDQLVLGDVIVKNFEVEVGVMNYGFPIDGILGLDFLSKIGAIIDLKKFEIHI
ncbi:MAG: putative aspartyl protease [bacterium]|jgi:predicted aspartyl protease